jgi:hypothetical protein
MLNLLFDEKDLNIKYFNILFYNGSECREVHLKRKNSKIK